MDSTQLCRLCLQSSEDVVNIWKTFQHSTIATILAKHFWFQINKDDGLTEWLCQICWVQTKSFHEFYRKVEECQKLYWHSITSNGDDKDEAVVVEPDLSIVKCEETELALGTINSQKNEADDFDYNEDSDDAPHSSNHKMKPSDKASQSDDNLQGPVERKVSSSHCRPDKLINRAIKEEVDARICEWFTMKCDICNDFSFETLLDVRRHYSMVHKVHGYLTCCDKKFEARHAMVAHMRRHTNPDTYRCEQCERNFKTKYSFKIHIANHVPIDSRAFKCSSCSSSFPTEAILRLHTKTKHPAETGEKFPCEKCGKNYRSAIMLKNHIRLVHKSHDYVCEICARQFKSKHTLHHHVTIEHSTTPPPKVQCNICDSWFKTKYALTRHIKEQHQDNKPVNCPVCDKVLRHKQLLSGHMRSYHAERKYECVLCDKAFKCAKNLKEHVATHTGEDLYKCQYCDKKFKSSANMYSHRKNTHLAEWTRDNEEKASAHKAVVITKDEK
ncbi:hypothetical protein HA402_009645 [Bradysia odoriphaga]|nr:hypothetical protein HA402_009645 [Bradysia odoriphaga]